MAHNPKIGGESTPEYLNQKQLEKLAEDPKNKVYTYVNDEATATFTVAEQKQHINHIRQLYLGLREKNPDWSDYRLREEIRNNHKILNSFAENNTRIFDTLTSKESTLDSVNHIRYMLYLRDQQEGGVIDGVQAQQMIQDYLITAFKTNMTPAQYEKMMKSKQ
jgi:hypothetical protein